MHPARWWLTVAMVALCAGCGGGSAGETAENPSQRSEGPLEMGITLDGYPGPGNVGVLMAEERGYFDDAGLKVGIYTPMAPSRPIKYVAQGVVDLAISHEPQVAMAQQNGVPIVAVGSLVPQPTAAMIWTKGSKIDGIADLKGKTIAIQGLPFQNALLQAILARVGLSLGDVEVEGVNYRLSSALTEERADAILGNWNVEGRELKVRGLEPVVTPVQTLGVPAYDEQVLITRRDRLAENPRSIRAFVAAVVRGNEAAIRDPEAATRAILDGSGEEKPILRGDTKTSREAAEAGMKATLPLLSRSGRMSESRARALLVWMHRQGLIEREGSAAALLTNGYLPAAGR